MAKELKFIEGLEVSRATFQLAIFGLQMILFYFVKLLGRRYFGVKAVLRCFELVLGLRIILGKSCIIGLDFRNR